MKIQLRTLPALLCTLALATVGCQKAGLQSTESPDRTTEPRVAQVTPPAPLPTATPPAVSSQAATGSEPYVLEEPGRASSPPAAAEPRDVEQPPRAVVPPVRPAPAQPRAEPKPDRERRLDSRERRLTQRQAALDARERRLRHQETEQPAPSASAPSAGEAEGPAPDQPAENAPVPEAAPEPRRPEPATVSAGTKLDIRFNRSLSSGTSTAGEIFRARIDQDIYAGDRIAIPAGSEVVGEVTQAGPQKKIGGKAVLGLRFTDLVLPSGETVPLKASFEREGQSKSGRDAATIGGVAAGGAILGRILSKGGGKGTVLGALLGAVAGSAIAARNPGEEVVIPEGSVVGIVLDRPVEIQGRR
jgi:type IV secretory pathway VirB10-like protein